MRQVFRDKLLQDHFAKNGYVKMQILGEAQIKVLTQLYSDLTQDNTPNGFFSTIGEHTPMKKFMHQHFAEHFSNLWSDVLYDYKPVFSNFITKKSADSKIDYHQDWSFIDESNGKCSLNIWCPLVETFHENGNLALIPGLQHLQHQLRTSNSYYSPYGHCQDYFKRLALEVPTAAGEAIIYDNALVHGSTPNLSGTNRLTASILAIPNEENIVIHLISGDKKTISLYKVDDDYLLNHNPFIDVPPQVYLYKQIPFQPIENPVEELRQFEIKPLHAAASGKNKRGFFKKVFSRH